MNTRYEQELQDEILNEEEIKYDNDDVENEYLKHLWDQKIVCLLQFQVEKKDKKRKYQGE